MLTFAGDDDSLRLMSCIFLLSFSILLLPFSHLSLYVSERRLYCLDSKSRLYSPSAYFVSHSLAGLPFSFLSGVLLSFTAYALVGLENSPKAILLTGLASGLLNVIAIQALVLAVLISPTQDIAAVVTIAYDALCVYLAGFLVPMRDLIPLLEAISYVSPMRYYFALVATLQLESSSCSGGDAGSVAAASGNPVCVSQQLREQYDIRGTVGVNFIALCTVLAVLYAVSFAALKVQTSLGRVR